MKFTLGALIFICLSGSLDAASHAATHNLNHVCTREIYEFTAQAQHEYQLAASSSLFTRSIWVKDRLTLHHTCIDKFVVEIPLVLEHYEKVRHSQAASKISAVMAGAWECVRRARNYAITARVKNATEITTEANAVLTVLEGVQNGLKPYLSWTADFQLLSTMAPDDLVNRLANGIYRTAKVYKDIMFALSNRTRFDPAFPLLTFSFDYIISDGTPSSINAALGSQMWEYDHRTDLSVNHTYTSLDATRNIYTSYVLTLIDHFNVFSTYAKVTFQNAISRDVSHLVTAKTIDDVYVPLSREIVDGLSAAHMSIYYEFLVAIVDARNEIEGHRPGDNGVDSSAESNGSDISNNQLTAYTMKGEVKKYQKRGRGLMRRLQRLYVKNNNAAICGAVTINSAIKQINLHHQKIYNCTAEALINFRIVLKQISWMIKTEVDKTSQVIKDCAIRAKKEQDDGGCSCEESASCTKVSLSALSYTFSLCLSFFSIVSFSLVSLFSFKYFFGLGKIVKSLGGIFWPPKK